MKNHILAAFFIILLLTPISVKANELDRIKANYKSLLLSEQEDQLISTLTQLNKETIISDQVVTELTEKYPSRNEEVKTLLDQLMPEGNWKDIDYKAQNKSSWTPGRHANRILFLAKVYKTPNQTYFNSPELLDAIHLTFKYWSQAKLVSPNWWHNQIGVPKAIGSAAILIEDKLTSEEKEGVIEIMHNAKFGMTGQNKVWLAGNVLMRALLENDTQLVKVARDTIFSEIRIGYGNLEGIKSDWSYHQHGAQQQFGNYGSAYIASMAFWTGVFRETPMAANQQQLDLLHMLITQGYQRILWNGYMDVAALGRQYFKQAQRHKGLATLFAASQLAQSDKKNRQDYKRFIGNNVLIDQKTPDKTSGLYHFWKSDQTIQRTSEWMTSLKMSSSRVIGSEDGNGDNLQGYYLGCGAMYTYIEGDEYHDIFACWDWRRIPGVTSHITNKALKTTSWNGVPNKKDFVGNISTTNDLNYGFSVMDKDRDNLRAKKAWLFTPQFVLCMGTAIKSDSLCEVNTSIEQNRKKSELLYLNDNEWTTIVDKKTITNGSIKRFHHNSTGYIIMDDNSCEAGSELRTKAWNKVMNIYPENDIDTKEVISLQISHGESPQCGSYQYLVLPMVTPQQTKDFDLTQFEVISNDSNAQIVRLKSQGKLYIALHSSAQKIEIEKNLYFSSSHPGLFILSRNGKQWTVTVSDPTQKLESTTLTIGTQIKKEISLPDGEMKGTSLTINL